MSRCALGYFFLSVGEMGLSGLRSGDSEPLMLLLLLGEEMGSDSLEQPALFLQLLASLLRNSPGVAAHWKDMGSKSKLEIPAAGGQRSRSSSGTHIAAWTRSAPWRLSLRVWALWSSLLLPLRASSRVAAEMASLVERGLRGQGGGGSPAIQRRAGWH